MHSNFNIWLTWLVSSCFLVSVDAQTTKPLETPGRTAPSRPVISSPASSPAASPVPATSNAAFHETELSESAPQPPAILRQISAQLSGTLVGQPPNISISFVLTLENTGLQEVRILDPLDFLSLQFTTTGNKLIPLPKRVPKFLPKTGVPKNSVDGPKPDAPYPAPIQLRQIVRVNGVSSQKEDSITVLPGVKIQMVFEGEPVVMQKIIEALRTETGDAAKAFKTRATISLVAAPPAPGVGGRLLETDWISLTIPSL